MRTILKQLGRLAAVFAVSVVTACSSLPVLNINKSYIQPSTETSIKLLECQVGVQKILDSVRGGAGGQTILYVFEPAAGDVFIGLAVKIRNPTDQNVRIPLKEIQMLLPGDTAYGPIAFIREGVPVDPFHVTSNLKNNRSLVFECPPGEQELMVYFEVPKAPLPENIVYFGNECPFPSK